MFARGRMAAGVAGVLVSLSGAEALACFDGSSAHIGRVTVTDGDDTYSIDRAAHAALWLARIDAILPEGASLEVHFGSVMLSLPAGSNIELPEDMWMVDEDLPRMFQQLARALKVPMLKRLAALAVEPPALWTVQAGTFKTEAQARARAEVINQSTECDQGFMQAGGFPATNAATLIEPVETATGTVYRVNVGMHTSRVAAIEAQGCLVDIPQWSDDEDEKTTIASFVRPVAWPAAYE